MAALSTRTQNHAGARTHAEGARRLSEPLVLVVEDHEDTLFLLTYLLDMRGCRVQVAKDGEQALRMAEAERPDLVLMDISLPRMDGLSAVRRMREVERLRATPIVFLSGHAEASFRAQALAEGGDEYLVKPFTIGQIDRLVQRFLGQAVAGESITGNAE
jgi:two-component system cell cycle response regulator DivK